MQHAQYSPNQLSKDPYLPGIQLKVLAAMEPLWHRGP